MKIAVKETQFFIRNLTLRVPFRYGIANMTRTPHLVVRSVVEIDGKLRPGFAADNLIPKWFTKNPDTSFREEIEDMLEAIQSAASIAHQLPPMDSVFAWWLEVYRAQEKWAPTRKFPPLLSGFGVSLIERSVIDAFCRATSRTFAQAVRENALGMRLGDIHPELGARTPAEFLPPKPERTIIARHTVGMADALGDDEKWEGTPDGLPHSLEEFIREQGLTHFKIKLGGNIEQDRARLRRIAEVIGRHTAKCAFTLDGNENFRAVEPFRVLWEGLRSDSGLERFLAGLIFVEQPFHRDVALSAATTADLLAWKDRPPIIIDESGGTLDAMRIALGGGYAGASHKNCKGVFHGIADACLIEQRRAAGSERPLHMCAEDLTNLGPIAVTQDLAVVATLGIRHVERNGHHYFAGLSQFPQAVQRDILRHHGDLYTRHSAGYPTVRIDGGVLAIGSIVDAPFGVGFEPDLAEFTPLADWRYESMEDGPQVDNQPQLR
jgi:hypothetical protein